MMITIEKGIPIAEGARYGAITEALRKMEKGDSFVIGLDNQNGVYKSAKRLRIPITSRRMGNGEIRVWRTK